MRKYSGYKLSDILNSYITEFDTLIKLINYENFLEKEEYDKEKRKSKKGRR